MGCRQVCMEWDESELSDPVQSNHKQSQYSLKILSHFYWQDTEILLTNFFDCTKIDFDIHSRKSQSQNERKYERTWYFL